MLICEGTWGVSFELVTGFLLLAGAFFLLGCAADRRTIGSYQPDDELEVRVHLSDGSALGSRAVCALSDLARAPSA